MKAKVLPSVQPNRGIEKKYRCALMQMTGDMIASTEYWVRAQYRKTPPKMEALAQDALPPSKKMQKTLKELADRWVSKFDEWADPLATAYLASLFKTSDAVFRKMLKDAGWAVDFTMTPVVRDAFNASLAKNVSLIKSIPEQYFTQVEGIVMGSYVKGGDLQAMVKGLKLLYPKATDRCVLIARDQTNKANAVVNRARQLELGMTEAVWMHSHAGKVPRPDHLAANGKRYKIAEGCQISGKFIQPGELIKCQCTARPVLPF